MGGYLEFYGSTVMCMRQNAVTGLVFYGCQYNYIIYRISSKSRPTLKSRRPRDLAVSICQLISINAALEISPHGKGSTAISVCVRAFYVHTTRLIIEAVYVRACQSL